MSRGRPWPYSGELGKAERQNLKVTKATRGQNQKGFEGTGSRHSCPLTFRPEKTRKLIAARVTPDNKGTGGEETPLTESRVPRRHLGDTVRARPWALAHRTVTGQADDGQKRSRVQCAFRKLSLGAQKTRHCSLDAAGQCVVSTGFSPLERSLIAVRPRSAHHNGSTDPIPWRYPESSQFSQEDEEDLVIVGQCAHRSKKKRGHFYERAMPSSYLPQESHSGEHRVTYSRCAQKNRERRTRQQARLKAWDPPRQGWPTTPQEEHFRGCNVASQITMVLAISADA